MGCRDEKEGDLLCSGCFRNIKINKTFFCGECRARLPENKKICHKSFPYVLGAATDYEGVVNELITGMKFKFWKEARRPLQKILAVYAENLPVNWAEIMVIPIPLSGQRERERGFNQAMVLAEMFREKFGAKIFDRLERIRNSRPQSETDFQKRRENVAGVFQVKNVQGLEGRRVVLVDDVVTSGATFFEAAKTLKKVGVKSITAIAVASA